MIQNIDAVRWTAPSKEVLLSEEFDEGLVVYSFSSNETHFLNKTAAAVLQLLQAEPRTLSGVVTSICSIFEIDDSPPLTEDISGVIQQFERLELLPPASNRAYSSR